VQQESRQGSSSGLLEGAPQSAAFSQGAIGTGGRPDAAEYVTIMSHNETHNFTSHNKVLARVKTVLDASSRRNACAHRSKAFACTLGSGTRGLDGQDTMVDQEMVWPAPLKACTVHELDFAVCVCVCWATLAWGIYCLPLPLVISADFKYSTVLYVKWGEGTLAPLLSHLCLLL
jgi:hypothetical protein